MRIALLHYTYAPIIGGVEIVMAAHARIFREAGHDVIVVCQRGDERDPAVRVLPGRILMSDLDSAFDGADLVIAHNVMTMPFDLELTEALWELAAKRGRQRFVSWIHDLAALSPDYDFDRQTGRGRLLSEASPHVEHIAVSSHRAAQCAALTGVMPHVIPNGVDPAAVLGLTPPVLAFVEAEDLWRRDLLLFHPARFVRRKNIELSLEVTAAIRAVGMDAALLVTGAADAQNASSEFYRHELHDLRRHLELEGHVFFIAETFAVTTADLGGLYGVADALFFPSHHEGFGLPLVEAALHRLPIFCPDVPPMNSLLAPDVHCFPAGSAPAEIARLVALTLDQDPAHQARRDALSRYTWKAVMDRHLGPFLQSQVQRS